MADLRRLHLQGFVIDSNVHSPDSCIHGVKLSVQGVEPSIHDDEALVHMATQSCNGGEDVAVVVVARRISLEFLMSGFEETQGLSVLGFCAFLFVLCDFA
jgi:hypothetical protein